MKDNYNPFDNNSFHSSNSAFNQGQSPFSQSANSLTRSSNPHFQLCKLYQDFEQDEQALKEFLEVLLTDLNKLRINILKAFRQNDLALYEQVHYKTLTPLKIINATTLQNLLAEGRELMEKEGITPEGTIFVNLKQEFTAVLMYLKALK